MNLIDRFFEATECSPITIILALAIVVLLWIVGKLYFRNTSLANHIMEADKNNAVLMVELKSVIDKVYTADETNAEKIITKIDNLESHVRSKGK